MNIYRDTISLALDLSPLSEDKLREIDAYSSKTFSYSYTPHSEQMKQAISEGVKSSWTTERKATWKLNFDPSIGIDRWKKMSSDDNPMKKLRTNAGTFKKGHKPVITAERNEKVRSSKIGSKNPNYGKKGTADIINTKITCPTCGLTINKGNYVRWHKPKCIPVY